MPGHVVQLRVAYQKNLNLSRGGGATPRPPQDGEENFTKQPFMHTWCSRVALDDPSMGMLISQACVLPRGPLGALALFPIGRFTPSAIPTISIEGPNQFFFLGGVARVWGACIFRASFLLRVQYKYNTVSLHTYTYSSTVVLSQYLIKYYDHSQKFNTDVQYLKILQYWGRY